MSSVAAWLERHGLSQYADVFAQHEIELGDMPELSDDDLKTIGLPLGPRRRFLRAVRQEAGDALLAGRVDAEADGRTAATIIAERRQLTVMFIDLVGSTELSRRLDPEDLAEALRLFKETCATAVAEFDGHIANYLGDGIMVFFGFPYAHEDDAERAILAGLRITREIPEIRTHARLQVRIGIATGLVVVGDLRGAKMFEDGTAMGETPNLAARLQVVAEPGTLIVAASTRQLAGDRFEYVERGPFELKGFASNVRAWRVTGVREVVSRFLTADRATLNPLVGRTRDYSTLHEKWTLACGGLGQVVLVSGEAGIGKSRLVEELRIKIADAPHVQLRFQCSPYHHASAFYPVIRQFERAAKLQPGDSDEDKLDKLATVLGDRSGHTLKLAASLLSIPFEHRLGPLELTPQQLKEQTLEMLIDKLLAYAAQQPVLLLFEDAHWIDPTTKSLLDRIVARVRDIPVLAVVTFRTGFETGWELRSNLTNLPLTQLDFEQVKAIVNTVANGRSVPAQFYELIAARSNGVPLYVEEVTKDFLESDMLKEHGATYRLQGRFPALSVPSTLQDALMARLDRLNSAKEVAQVGTVFGPRFSFPMLAAVSRLPETELRRSLERLTEAGIITLTGTEPIEVFSYRHDLIRDTAYNSLLKRQRQSLHARAAQALRQDPRHALDTGPEILAHHYTVARMVEEAVEHWYLAGRHAVERSANTEAATHLANAVEQLNQQEEGPDRDRREIEIQVMRAGVLRSTAGIAADDTGEVYTRIHDLCRRTGETDNLFPVLNGLYAFYLVRAEYNRARDVAGQLLELAGQSGETQHTMVAHRAMGAVLLHIGQLEPAREHLERSLELYDPDQHGRLAYVYGTDHAAITSSFLSIAVWLLGEPDRALELQTRAVEAAQELDHAHSVAQALTYLCMLHLLRRDTVRTRETAERLTSLSNEHSFAFMSLTATFWRSWADAHEAPGHETVRALREAADAWWSGGAGNYKPFFSTLIAEIMLKAGDREAALQVLTEARAYQELTNEGWAQAEIDRVQALANSVHDVAESDFGTALETARRQNAKMFELRAAVDYVRRRQNGGSDKAAEPDLRALLGSIEGGETTEDVIAAQSIPQGTRVP